MYKKSHKLILLCAVFFSLFIVKQAFAEEYNIISSMFKKEIMSNSLNQSGYKFDIQKVEPALLAEGVEKLREALIRHQHKLAQTVANKELDTGDAIITIIIPGGLLYAAYRKQELEQIKNALLVVTNEINELSDDLIALQGQDINNPLILAQLP